MKFVFYVMLLCANVCIAQQTDIIWTKPVLVTINANSITKQQSSQIASAKSGNILDPNIKGWAEFKVADGGVRQGFGFIKSSSASNEIEGEIDFFNMDYSIQLFNNNTIKIYQNGDLFGQFGTYAVGNIFRIERRENQIVFYKNSVRLTTITDASIPSKSFLVNGVIKTNSSSIVEAKSSFVKPLSIISNVVDVHCQSSTNLGSISVAVSGGIQPYSYSWSNGAISSSLNNLKSGIYSVKVTDATSKEISANFTVLNCVDWTDLAGVSLNGTAITKTLNTEWGNAGAASENVLEGGLDGYVQFSPSNHVKFSALGLTFLNTDNNYTSIDYGFVIDSRRLFIFSSGKFQGDFGRLSNTDLLKIERKGNTILFYKNNIALYKTETKSEFDLVVDVALNTKHDFFENVKTTFFSKPLLKGIIKNYDHENAKGSVEVIVKGGYAPYNYAWNDIKIPSDAAVFTIIRDERPDLTIDSSGISSSLDSLRKRNSQFNLLPGNYPVTIYDQIDDSKKIVGVVGTKVDWALLKNSVTSIKDIQVTNTDRVSYFYDKGENISQSGEFISGTNYAVSDNNISKDYNNYVEFTISDIRHIAYLGFIEKRESVNDGIEDLREKTFFEFVGKDAFRIWFVDSYVFESRYNSGDIFAIETDSKNGDVLFYHNRKEVTRKKMELLKPDNNLLLKVMLGSNNAVVSNIVMRTTPMPISGVTNAIINGVVVDVSCGKPCSGSIDVYGAVNSFSFPQKYELINSVTGALMDTRYYSTGPNRAVFSGLCSGKYDVVYYFLKSAPNAGIYSVTNTFEVAYVPDWINDVNVTISPSDKSLIKTGGNAFNWDAGASSINTLKSNESGWIEWSGTTPDGVNGIGFSVNDADATISTINYGAGYFRLNFGLFGLWNFYIKTSNNTMLGSSGIGNSFRPYSTNDKFRLEKDHINHKITLTVNGLTDNFLNISPTDDYVIDAALKLMNGKISHPRSSFGCPTVLAKNYAVLKPKMDGHYYELDGNLLNFTVDGEYTLSSLKFRVLNNMQNDVVSSTLNPNLLNKVSMKLGDNRYYLDCNTLPVGYYTLEVTNEKSEKLLLRFKR